MLIHLSYFAVWDNTAFALYIHPLIAQLQLSAPEINGVVEILLQFVLDVLQSFAEFLLPLCRDKAAKYDDSDYRKRLVFHIRP